MFLFVVGLFGSESFFFIYFGFGCSVYFIVFSGIVLDVGSGFFVDLEAVRFFYVMLFFVGGRWISIIVKR